MRPIKILLVDDDEDDFILTKDILRENPRNQNYELSWCDNYSGAIHSIMRQKYDIYLVDYRLGKYSGIDLLHEAIGSNCTEPIIILTGKGDIKIDEEALKIGAADYLVKDNINSFTLERSIRYALEHNKALQALKASENKFRIIFERSNDPIIITDPAGRIYEANPAAISFFETSKKNLLNLKAADLYANPSQLEKFTALMEEKGSVTELELEFKTSKGRNKICSISSFVQISQHGATELYHTMIHDLTHLKEQELESVKSEKAGAIERIARILADEIRNPLSNVNLALDELSSSLKGQDEILLLDIVKNNSKHIARLITDFIASTQPSLLDVQTINANVLIDDIIKETDGFYINVTTETPNELLYIAGDEEKLKFAFKKIIDNAIESMNSVNTNLFFRTERAGNNIIFNIRDTGEGISSENLSKIFEPFFTTKPGASGLGLTQAQQIIDAHNGKINIRSTDKGTTVTVILPLQE